jgi:uncharacterized protein (DUF1778 family)
MTSITIPEDEWRFYEECVPPLMDRDRDRFLALLDNPPAPNEALWRDAEEYSKRRPQAKNAAMTEKP